MAESFQTLGCQATGWNPAHHGSGVGTEHHVVADGAAAPGCLSRESQVGLLVLMSLPWQTVVTAIS